VRVAYIIVSFRNLHNAFVGDLASKPSGNSQRRNRLWKRRTRWQGHMKRANNIRQETQLLAGFEYSEVERHCTWSSMQQCELRVNSQERACVFRIYTGGVEAAMEYHLSEDSSSTITSIQHLIYATSSRKRQIQLVTTTYQR
jgi:hypothetical protein